MFIIPNYSIIYFANKPQIVTLKEQKKFLGIFYLKKEPTLSELSCIKHRHIHPIYLRRFIKKIKTIFITLKLF